MQIGQTLLQRYQVTQSLGSGGFSETYLAQDLALPGHPYCVVKLHDPKVSAPQMQAELERRFEQEAQMLYRLGEHSQIPRLHAHFKEGQQFFLVQEFIDGHELTQELVPGQGWPESKIWQFLQELLKVLTVLHEQGVIHRDLKPSNILRRKSDQALVLIDFGAVKALAAGSNSNPAVPHTLIIGTLGYLAPEQASGMPQLASDIYAVGIIALQALSGLHPQEFVRDPQTGELDWRSRLPNLSPGLVNILERMVCSRWQDRYANAMEAIAALEGVSVPTIVSARAQPIYLQPTQHSARPRLETSQPETRAVAHPNASQGFADQPNLYSAPRKNWPIFAGIASACGVLGIGLLIYAQQPKPSAPVAVASSSVSSESSAPTVTTTPTPAALSPKPSPSPKPVQPSPPEASPTATPPPSTESSASPDSSNDSSKVPDSSDREGTQTATVIDPPSNVRTAPNGSIVCAIPTVTEIAVFNPNGDWYQTDACGTIGYIHRSQIQFANAASEASPETPPEVSNATSGQLATVIDPPSNIRVQPNGAILCSIKSVQSIRVSRSSGDWYVTDACGSDGYIHRSQLRF
jgi:serine/threonine protein kinase